MLLDTEIDKIWTDIFQDEEFAVSEWDADLARKDHQRIEDDGLEKELFIVAVGKTEEIIKSRLGEAFISKHSYVREYAKLLSAESGEFNTKEICND